MAIPAVLTLAWWTAKWALARKSGAGIADRAKPWFTPWVVVPVVVVAGLIVLQLSVNAAYNRGDTAGYQRRDNEAAESIKAINQVLELEAAETSAKFRANAEDRARLLSDIRLAAAAKQTAEVLAKSSAEEAALLAASLKTVKAQKTRWRIRNVFKTRTVTQPAGGPCSVGPEITAKLNMIN